MNRTHANARSNNANPARESTRGRTVGKSPAQTSAALRWLASQQGAQAKLQVAPPDDIFEREADQVAEAVMRKPAPNSDPPPNPNDRGTSSSAATHRVDPSRAETQLLQTKPASAMLPTLEPDIEPTELESPEAVEELANDSGGGGAPIEPIEPSLEAAEATTAEPEEPVQAKSLPSASGAGVQPSLPNSVRNSKSHGKPMEPALESDMSRRFGHDLSGVRIHNDQPAVVMNRQLQARAFTYQTDIYFNSGEYQPDSAAGKELLAHEITHTLQQGAVSDTVQRLEQPGQGVDFDRISEGPMDEAELEDQVNHDVDDLLDADELVELDADARKQSETASPPDAPDDGESIVQESMEAEQEGSDPSQPAAPAPADSDASSATGVSEAPAAASALEPAASGPTAAKGAQQDAASGDQSAGGKGNATAEEKSAEASAPDPHQAIAPATRAVRKRAAGARKHRPANVAVDSSQQAAKRPKTEQARGAAEATVDNLDAAKEGAQEVKRNDFKDKLKQAIADATPEPKSESDAEKVMKTGAKQANRSMRAALNTQRDTAVGPLESAAAAEVAPESQPAAAETSLSPEPVGAPPAAVSAAPVVPAPLPPERLDYSSDRGATDQVMAENEVTQEQLAQGNEPAFGPALEARTEAEQHEATAEQRYRESEAGVRDQAQGTAQGAIQQGLGGVHGVREAQIGAVVGEQVGTRDKDAAERIRITDKINSIKDKTKADVTTILDGMDAEATRLFEAGLKRAEDAYEDAFEEAKGGIGTWLTTWGDDWDEHIEQSLATARRKYLSEVDLAIDQVADCVDSKLKQAKQRVADGRAEVKKFVDGLDESVKKYGDEALEQVNAEFDAMASQIDERRDGLINKLTQQYKASYERMSAREEKLRAENQSLWTRVYNATVGLVKKIIAFKDMLLGVLGKAAGVIGHIIAHPIEFLGNLVTGVMQGLQNFMSNILTHLQKGLMGWLFGALGGAGLQIPEKFNLEGIINLILQILGLTYANFRARAVKIVGEDIVKGLETTAEVFMIVISEGVSGLWRFIKEQLANLKSLVIDGILDFVKERVIIAGVTWIIGLLNPASAFFKACKAIYDIIMFFINRGSQIMSLVNAVLDSVAAIAKGAVGAAANLVEAALAKAIPVAIGFLASLLGLGDPSQPIRKLIDKARKPINKAIDWVIGKAVKVAKKAGGLLFGKKSKKGKQDEGTENADPSVQAKVDAANAFIDEQEAKLGAPDEIGEEQAEKVAAAARQNRKLFKSASVAKQSEFWEYSYSVNPTKKKKTPAKPQFSDSDDKQNLKDLDLSLSSVPHPPQDEQKPKELIGPQFDKSRSKKERIWSKRGKIKAWRFEINKARFNKVRDKKGGLEFSWWNRVQGEEAAKQQLQAEEDGRKWLQQNYDDYVDLTPPSKVADDRTDLQKVSTPGIDVPALGTVTEAGAKQTDDPLGREAGKEALLVGEAKRSDYKSGRYFKASEVHPSVAERAIDAATKADRNLVPRVKAALASGNIVYTILLSGKAKFSQKQVDVHKEAVKADLRKYLLGAGYEKEEIDQAVKNVIVRTQEI